MCSVVARCRWLFVVVVCGCVLFVVFVWLLVIAGSCSLLCDCSLYIVLCCCICCTLFVAVCCDEIRFVDVR